MKKFISVLLVACIVLSFGSFSAVFAEDEKDYKFKAKLSSVAGDGTGSVTGTVFTDYSAELVFDGNSVNRSNFKVEVWMKNVESLGVSDEKYYVREADTGITGKPDSTMATVKGYFNKIQEGTSVTGIVLWTDNNDETTYSFSRGENDKIIATPDSNASTVWHDIVNDEYVKTGDDTNSRFLLAKDSWLQVGNKKLEGKSDLTVDNISDYQTNVDNIRAALDYTTVENADAIKVIKMFLKAGTRLTLGNRYAELKQDVMITIDVGADGEDADEYDDSDFVADLDRIWQSDTKDDYITAVLTALQNFTNAMGGRNTTVVFGEEDELIVENHTNNKFKENEDNKDIADDEAYSYTIVGHTVTVTSAGDTLGRHMACKIGYLENGKYVAVTAERVKDDQYKFAVDSSINKVILVIKGDADLNGRVVPEDASNTNKASIRKITLEPINTFAVDVTGNSGVSDGRITPLDASAINKWVLVKGELPW